jgi:glycosyltransferase involved in cell wall biosynthesis
MSHKCAVIISCFNYYEIRLKYIEDHLRQNAYDVVYITSDFDHITKKSYVIDRAGTLQIHARPYKRNLSVARMLSHYLWARNVFKKIYSIKPDLLFVMLPPNSLARHSALYKRKTGVRLVFDIYDLWPETYPLSRSTLTNLLFHFWRRMRDKYLKHADYITFECFLFQSKLLSVMGGKPSRILYPALVEAQSFQELLWDEDIIQLAYLGSINNIIDITSITKLAYEIKKHKHLKLHIIGVGESKEKLIESIRAVGAEVVDHGPVYDITQKQTILNRCRFGLNIMKNTVCVGLTMKSIDYFRAGLPIVNTIQGDTFWLVDNYGIGYNLLNYKEIATKIAYLTKHENLLQRQKARELYSCKFSPMAFHKTFSEIYKEWL